MSGLHDIFGPFLLDRDRRVLLCDGEPVAVGQRGIRILEAFLRQAGEVLTKAELMDAGWPGVTVEESNLSVQVASLRRALDQASGGGEWIATIPRVGYRFVGRINARRTAAHPPTANIAKPSLAILPFVNLSADPRDEAFAEGLSEEIITAFCRVRSLSVIPRGSAFLYKRRAVAAARVARELDVRYVLGGSLRKAGRRLRFSGHLIDVAASRQVWSERFESSIDDIFELQDRIASGVVGAVEPAVRLIEAERAAAKPAESSDAYELYLRSLSLHHSNSQEGFAEAQRLLARAIQIDADYATAKAFAALTTATRTAQGWTTRPERQQGIRWAREAIADHNDDPVVQRYAAHALALLAQEYDLAIALLDRALSLHPNSSEVHHSAGWAWVFACDGGRAMEHFEQAMRLNPLDPERGRTLAGVAFAQLLIERYSAALRVSTEAMAAMPTSLVPLRAAIMALVQMGNRQEATAMGRRLLDINPDFTIDYWNKVASFRDTVFVERYIKSLRAAGLPER